MAVGGGFLRSLTTIPTADEVRRFPIHSKPIPPLDLGRVKAIARESGRIQWAEEVQAIEDAIAQIPFKVAPSLVAHYAKTPEITGRTLQPEDISTLVSHAIIRKLTKRERRTAQLGTAFAVVEGHKQRRRFIYWPRDINGSEKVEEFVPELYDILTHLECLTGRQRARVFDLAASFYQVALSAEVQTSFAFRYGAEVYCMMRLPMGFRLAPAMMEAILQCLLPAPRMLQASEIIVGTHIDNVRFLGAVDNTAVDAMSDIFRANCELAGVTVNPEESAQTTPWLGVTCDYQRGLVSLGPKIREKLQTWRLTPWKNLSLAQLESLMALICYASRLMRLDVVQFYPLIKCFRRKLSASRQLTMLQKCDTPANLWPSVIVLLRQWLDAVLAAPPTSHGRDVVDDFIPQYTLFTDASTVGWGAVLHVNGRLSVLGGKWEHPRLPAQINETEVDALTEGLRGFRYLFPSRPFRLRMVLDNTSAVAAMPKPVAKAEALAKAIKVAKDNIPVGAQVTVEYISTRVNPADAPSRGQLFDQEKCSLALGAIGRREARGRLVRLPRRDITPVC